MRVLRYWSIGHFAGFVAPAKAVLTFLVLFPVSGVLEDRNTHLTASIGYPVVPVEVRYRAGVVIHGAESDVEVATSSEAIMSLNALNPLNDFEKIYPGLGRKFFKKPHVPFGHDNKLDEKCVARKGIFPSHPVGVFVQDLVYFGINRAKGAEVGFEPFAHFVILFKSATSFETKELFGCEFVFDRHGHGRFLQVECGTKKSGRA